VSGVPPEALRTTESGLQAREEHSRTPKPPSENQPGENVTPNSYFFRTLLVLLCYKRRAQQKGQCESWVRRKRAILIRRVAIEAGLCRSARARRTARLEVKRKLGGA
jgi:hypothetical protein